MNDYVVSRQLADKLREAGFKSKKIGFYYTEDVLMFNQHDYDLSGAMTPAPLSDELLGQLPMILANGQYLLMEGSISLAYGYAEYGEIRTRAYTAEKPADALAELWLFCKEQGYITISAQPRVGDAQ